MSLNGLVSVWDVASGNELYHWRSEDCTGLTIDGSGNTLACFGDNGVVRLFESFRETDEEVFKTRKMIEQGRSAVGKVNIVETLEEDKIQMIKASDSLAFDVREAALDILRVSKDNPYALNQRSWEVLTSGNQDQYPMALSLAQRAHEIVPECAQYRLTLGFSHYRLDDYGQAAEFLSAANQMGWNDDRDAPWNDKTPIDVYGKAILAMVQCRTGDLTNAAINLDVAKANTIRFTDDPVAVALIEEAELLFDAEKSS